MREMADRMEAEVTQAPVVPLFHFTPQDFGEFAQLADFDQTAVADALANGSVSVGELELYIASVRRLRDEAAAKARNAQVVAARRALSAVATSSNKPVVPLVAETVRVRDKLTQLGYMPTNFQAIDAFVDAFRHVTVTGIDKQSVMMQGGRALVEASVALVADKAGYNKGTYTAMKASATGNILWANLANELDLAEMLSVGEGVTISSRMLADTAFALVFAAYLDNGQQGFGDMVRVFSWPFKDLI
jgi:hypothetical protein